MKKLNCILLVDDNPADNEFHKRAIQKAGIANHIRIAEDGVEALEYIVKSADKAQQKEFPKADLIFLDINMPRMNGFEFLEEYTKLSPEFKAQLVIVMLTTSMNPDDHEKAKSFNGTKDFYTKPLTDKMLGEIMKKYFG